MQNKLALISVSDKTDLDIFAKKLIDLGFEIVATNSTCEFLRSHLIECKTVESITGFEEILDGKVKTLHPKIHASILANPKMQDELNLLKKLGLRMFSLVVCNLYPFEKVAKETDDVSSLVKNIDIGGVTLLRAASKNFENVVCVSEVSDYDLILEQLEQYGSISEKTAESLATKAFFTTSKYDCEIVKKFQDIFDLDDNYFCLNSTKAMSLRYGENPHQKASLYHLENEVKYEVLNGKELSYNNFLDMTYALNIVSEFFDVPSCSIVKHNIPCGVAIGISSLDAWRKALDCDPISAFGGVVAFSFKVDEKLAKEMTSMFLEVVVAQDFTDEAIEVFKAKKNLRIVKLQTPLNRFLRINNYDLKMTPFGLLVQKSDSELLRKEDFKVVTKEKPDEKTIEDLIFAFKVAKHVKSNAIVVAKNFKTLGISGGNTSRIESSEIALQKACDSSKDAVLASDGFFPAVDNIEVAAQNRIKAIIQPGGSIKDNLVIEQCNKYGIIMVTTNMRHFKH